MMLPMLPQTRPVDKDWSCQGSGDCCTIPKALVMTTSEAEALVHAAPREITMQFDRTEEKGFVSLRVGPCPLFAFGKCLVYEMRPYNCRRFACMRPDPKTEVFEPTGELGCMNLEVRVKTSRVAYRLAQKIQRKAQRWAMTHGWAV